MPLHFHPSIETLSSRTGPTASPLSPTPQSDIMAILQQEQDHALSLLSLSPLLSSLFISYATRAGSAGSTPSTYSPSPESDEWKSLQDTVTILREENEKLKSEIREIAGKLEVGEAFQEVLRSQVSSLKDLNVNREEDVKSLQTQVSEAQQKYDRLAEDSNAEKAALKVQVSDLESQRGQLRETAVKQQIRISRLERPTAEDAIRGLMSPPPRAGGSVSTPSLPDSPISPFQPALPTTITSPYVNGRLVSISPTSPTGGLRPHPMSHGLIGTRYQPSSANPRPETTMSGWFGDDT